MTVAAIERDRIAASGQIIQCGEMGCGEIRDVDVIAHAGAIWSRVISAEDRHACTASDRRFDGDFDQQCRRRRALSDLAVGIASGNIEVAQDDGAQRMGPTGVTQHVLAHQLRLAVRIDRCRRRGLFAHTRIRHAIDRCSGREYEAFDTVSHAALDEISGIAGVVRIIAQRLLDRFRHDRERREMHDRVDRVAVEQPSDEVLIAGIADDQFAIGHRFAKTLAQVVQRDYVVAGAAEQFDDMRADVTSSTRDQDITHEDPRLSIALAFESNKLPRAPVRERLDHRSQMVTAAHFAMNMQTGAAIAPSRDTW